ncbi:hypothetical protein AB2B38_009680 [Balneola sp. MJW-20]|uniref:hypothetical protein n=1 Tax=Gracilimonas aurantiaca TaxID=3234185 RepID=UPI0034668BB8
MLKLKDTGLEEFSFGDDPDDMFYLLINRKVSPDGIDLDKLRLADPRNFDHTLENMGCILMLNGDEMDELVRRGELDKKNLHESLFELAAREGLIS